MHRWDKMDMRMGDLLNILKDLLGLEEVDKREIEAHFGRDIKLIISKQMPEPWEDTALIMIVFSGGYLIDDEYDVVDHLKRIGEECIF